MISKILQEIEFNERINTIQLSNILNESHAIIFKTVKNLQLLQNFIILEDISDSCWELTLKGESIYQRGFCKEVYPFHYWIEGKSNSVTTEIAEDRNRKQNVYLPNNPGMSYAHEHEEDVESLKLIKCGNFEIPIDRLNKLKLEQMIIKVTYPVLQISKGVNFKTDLSLHSNMTFELVEKDAWKEASFIPYNFEITGIPLIQGHLHPLTKMWRGIKHSLLGMGFRELPRRGFVETSPWNFDKVKTHTEFSDRDIVFFIEYLSNKSSCKDSVSSEMYATKYDEKIHLKCAEQSASILHELTSIGTMMLQQGHFKPQKMYHIDRVFQNQTADKFNSTEFFQVESIVLDYDLSFADLIGILHNMLQELGIKSIDIKPGFNPYTEPSLDIYCYHIIFDEWIKVGTSGMFRPEILNSCKVPSGVCAIWWILNLEKITMTQYVIEDMSKLKGPGIELQMFYNNPLS